MVIPKKDVFHPKYWGLWALLSLFWLIARLPYSWQIAIGKKIGRTLFRRYKRARKIITKNVAICFPGLAEGEQARLASQSGQELGVAIMETFLVWFRSIDGFLHDRFEVEGERYFDDAVDRQCGVILLSCHFGSVDLNAVLLSSLGRNNKKFVGTFRQTDEMVNRFLRSARGKYCDRLVSSTQQHAIVKELKSGNIVWYAPDIEVKSKGSVYADFMGVSASTTTAISRLAKISGAIVLPVAHYRVSDTPTYRLKIFPPLQDFPSGDIEVDTQRVNGAIEEIIKPHPDRYWWVIKRFKNQPDGKSLYDQ